SGTGHQPSTPMILLPNGLNLRIENINLLSDSDLPIGDNYVLGVDGSIGARIQGISSSGDGVILSGVTTNNIAVGGIFVKEGRTALTKSVTPAIFFEGDSGAVL